MPATKDHYLSAAAKLRGEGFTLDPKTCFFVRGAERLKLRWNGKVYARRRAPPVMRLELEYAPSPEAMVASAVALPG